MRSTFIQKFPFAAPLGVGCIIVAVAAIAWAQGAGGKSKGEQTAGSQVAQNGQAKPAESKGENRDTKKAQRRAASLGLQVQAQNDKLQVTQVAENSPAAQAGIQKNDQIVSVDGRTFTSEKQLDAYLVSQGSRRVPIVVERNGQRTTINFSAPQLAADTAWLGVFLQDGQSDAKGAFVTQVYPTGPAARAGLHPGDTIVNAGSQKIESPADLITLVQESEPQQQIEFTVMRNNQSMKIPVTLASRHDFMPHGNNQGNFQANYPHTFGGPKNEPNGAFDGEDEFSNVPPHAMGLEHDRRIAEQHQRIEDEIRQLREEIQKLREDLKKK